MYEVKNKMTLVKIRMNTWNRRGNRDTKFKRGLAPREGFIEMSKDTKQVKKCASICSGVHTYTGLDSKVDLVTLNVFSILARTL